MTLHANSTEQEIIAWAEESCEKCSFGAAMGWYATPTVEELVKTARNIVTKEQKIEAVMAEEFAEIAPQLSDTDLSSAMEILWQYSEDTRAKNREAFGTGDSEYLNITSVARARVYDACSAIFCKMRSPSIGTEIVSGELMASVRALADD